VEKFERPFTEKELFAELEKPSSEVDFDYLLKRAGALRAGGHVYDVAGEALRLISGGEAAWRQATAEYYVTHGDDRDERWWLCARTNELLGRPLKLENLPDWDLPGGSTRSPEL
jgi:hypothetical protein